MERRSKAVKYEDNMEVEDYSVVNLKKHYCTKMIGKVCKLMEEYFFNEQ